MEDFQQDILDQSMELEKKDWKIWKGELKKKIK